MSRTVPVSFGARNVWIYDESLAVWLVRFIDRSNTLDVEIGGRLARFVAQGRMNAVVGADFQMQLDDLLQDDALADFVSVATEVTKQLRAGGPLEIQPLAARKILDESTPVIRTPATPGATLAPEPIASVGDALVSLVRGTLPEPPAGFWWYFGLPGGLTTIRMRDSGRLVG